MFQMGKLSQLRTDFGWKGCANFLHENGEISPKYLHLDNSGKFSGTGGGSVHPPYHYKGEPCENNVFEITSKPMKILTLLSPPPSGLSSSAESLTQYF